MAPRLVCAPATPAAATTRRAARETACLSMTCYLSDAERAGVTAAAFSDRYVHSTVESPMRYTVGLPAGDPVGCCVDAGAARRRSIAATVATRAFTVGSLDDGRQYDK